MKRPAMNSIALRNDPIEALLPCFAEQGFREVEILGNQVEGKSDVELKELRRIAEDVNIKIICLSPYAWLTNREELYEETMERFKRFVHYCELLDCPMIRTFTDSGPTGIGSDVATEAHWAKAIEGLTTITSMSSDVLFVLENHEKTLADTPESIERLFCELPVENLELLIHPRDYGPAGTVEMIERFPGKIVHMHLNNITAAGEMTWLYEGVVDYAEIFKRLEGLEYGGYMSVEYCFPGVTWEIIEKTARFIESCGL